MRVAIIGAPVDLGADRRGVDMGPSAIRYAGLETGLRQVGLEVQDLGNISAPVAETADCEPSNLKYLRPILGMAKELAGKVEVSLAEGWFPLVIGGDHSVSLGSVTGVTRHHTTGIIWLDAHGDFNDATTSPSGNIHGMVLSALTGYGDERLVSLDDRVPKVRPQNVSLVGVRDLDEDERRMLIASGVHIFTMHQIDRVGLSRVMEEAIAHAGAGVDAIHLSLDLDVVDPLQAPGVGTPVLGGLNYRETHLAMELVFGSGRLGSIDVVEVNPVLDRQNETARLAMEFALSALGKCIL